MVKFCGRGLSKMKSLLILIPIVLNTFCVLPSYADTKLCPAERDNSYVGKCKNLKDGDNCASRVTGALTATCKNLVGCGDKDELTCTATKCKDGYYLWFYEGQSMGICRTPAQAQAYCDKYCTNNKNKNCKAILVKNYRPGIDANTGCQEEVVTPNNPPKTPPIAPSPIITPEPIIIPSGVSCTSETQCHVTSVFDSLDTILELHFSDSSVWKDDKGNFNTARLASDSIAGVVLGTIGGVVTSKIIKSHQIKSGFEHLKCTIGGQTVATYGDEFNVNVK